MTEWVQVPKDKLETLRKMIPAAWASDGQRGLWQAIVDVHEPMESPPVATSGVRLLRSRDELRVGQVVVCKHRIEQEWREPQRIGILDERSFAPWDVWTVAVLEDPSPEDELAEALADLRAARRPITGANGAWQENDWVRLARTVDKYLEAVDKVDD